MAVAERFGPFALAAAMACALVYFSDAMQVMAAGKQIDVSSLYSAMFDWSSIQTGFLFGVFGFVSGKSTGFIAEVSETAAMRTFNKYTRTAILLGFLLTFVSIPLTVTSFDYSGKPTYYYYIFVAWAFLAIWSFFSFARVAYVFGVMLKVRDKERVVG